MPKNQDTTDRTFAVSSAASRERTNGAVAPAGGPSAPDAAGGRLRAFSSLANRDFRYLWLGMMAMMGGMQMEMLAIGYLVYDITSSPLLLGVVEAGYAIPMLTLALFGGALADRLDRKRVIQISQMIQVCVATFITVTILTDTITWVHLLALALVEGSLFSFMMPARQAIIPQLVDKSEFTNAMAINSAAFSSTTLVSPAIAGGLYNLAGPAGVYMLITSLHVTAVLLTTQVRPVPPQPDDEQRAVVSDIREGLKYLFKTRLVVILLGIGLVATMLSWPFRALLPVFVVDVYDRGPEAMGLMLSLMGLGSLVGSLTIAHIGKWRRGLLLILGGFVSAVGLSLIAAIPMYYVAVGLMVIVGLGEAPRWTLSMTLIMENVEDRYRGRVSSVFMMNFGLMPLAVLPAGLAAEYFGGQATIGFMAGLLAVLMTAILITQKQVRRLE